MSNARFLHNFKFDSGTITSSSEVSGLPDDNAVDDFVAKKWRTETDTGEWIKFDLSSEKKITMVAIFGHNLTGGATIKIEANSSDSWSPSWDPPGYSQAMTWNEKAIVKFLDQTYQWWRITLEDGSNPDEHLEIGRICAGEYVEPDVNVNQEVQKKLIDPSVIQESAGRQGYAVEKEVYRTFDIGFTGIARAQQDQLATIFEAVKTINMLVFALDPDNYPEEDTIYCKLTTPLAHALRALGYGDVTLSFEEKVS